MTAKTISRIGLLAAITGLLAYLTIPLPFSPVPVTGQTLGVMLAGLLLPPGAAALAMTVLVLLGSAGLPVFAGGTSGLGILLGPTGGFLVGFIPGAAITSLLRGKRSHFSWSLLAAVAGGIFALYIPGLLWMAHLLQLPISKALVIMLPYLPGDILKALAAAFAATKLYRL